MPGPAQRGGKRQGRGALVEFEARPYISHCRGYAELLRLHFPHPVIIRPYVVNCAKVQSPGIGGSAVEFLTYPFQPNPDIQDRAVYLILKDEIDRPVLNVGV